MGGRPPVRAVKRRVENCSGWFKMLTHTHTQLSPLPTPPLPQNLYTREWVKHAMKSRTSSQGLWPQLMIFPEGTTHNQKALVHFKNGPFLPGVPVQPVLVRFPFKNCDPAWVTGGVSQLSLLHRLLCQFYNTLSVEYLPVYKPSAAEAGGDFASAKLFAKNVRAVMADALGVPTTEHR